jgi:hypothetical protein
MIDQGSPRVPSPPPACSSLAGRVKGFYWEHEPACTAGFFIVGFLFDMLAVGRIDRLRNILHQASYLLLCALLTGLELRELYGGFSAPRGFQTFWRYHTAATHFMLGTLLNIYTVFYFKSASLDASLIFLLILAAMLAVNELKLFETSGTTMRMGLFSLCLISYFTYLVPMLMGSLGTLPFMGSMAAAALVMAALAWLIQRRLRGHPLAIWKHALIPFAAVQACFIWLYFARLIPPVPLSLSSIGIYHDVRRVGERFALTTTRARWKFWQRGDQSFRARPGDKVHCFLSVISPARFKDRLQLRWLFLDPAGGWRESDVMPLDIIGGRDGGFRAVLIKSRCQPGRWRVRVETSDERELGRIDWTVIPDDSAAAPPTHTVLR